MALNKRERRVPAGNVSMRQYPRLSFEHALELVLSVKRTENLRERTLKDYAKHYGYFIDWLRKAHPDVENIGDITVAVVRDHISYMKYDRTRYEGHANIPTDNQRIGLSDTTVNIRLRTLSLKPPVPGKLRFRFSIVNYLLEINKTANATVFA